MNRNFLTETDLKSYVPNLDNLLPTSQLRTGTKEAAELRVRNDFLKSRYKQIYLREGLSLRSSGDSITSDTATDASDEDILSRSRWVINTTAFSGNGVKTLTLQGRNSEEDDWQDVKQATVNSIGEQSHLIGKFYKHYRIDSFISDSANDGAIDFSSELSESSFDLLYAYAWAAEIYLISYKAEGDQFYLKYLEYDKRYKEEFANRINYYDANQDGVIESFSAQSIRMYK